MEYGKHDLWRRPNSTQLGNQKRRALMSHPLTFLVLVWIFLFLVFYLVSEFIISRKTM